MIEKEFSGIGDPIIVISYPRSGTHLTIDLIRKQFRCCASYKYPLEPQHYLYLSIEGFLEKRESHRLTETNAIRIIKRSKRPIIKFHTYSYPALKERFPQWMDWIEARGKFIFVMRDVREVLCSYYIYAQSFERNANVPLSEFIKQRFGDSENRVIYWKKVIEAWSAKPNVLMLDYGKIIKDTEGAVRSIAEFIRETPQFTYPLLPRKLESIWQFRWNRLITIKPESTAILGTKHKEAKINWRKQFTADDLAFIEKNAGEVMRKFNL